VSDTAHRNFFPVLRSSPLNSEQHRICDGGHCRIAFLEQLHHLQFDPFSVWDSSEASQLCTQDRLDSHNQSNSRVVGLCLTSCLGCFFGFMLLTITAQRQVPSNISWGLLDGLHACSRLESQRQLEFNTEQLILCMECVAVYALFCNSCVLDANSSTA